MSHSPRSADGASPLSAQLIAAAGAGRLADVVALLDAGANIDLVGDGLGTAVCHAAREGHADIVDALLARGANPHRGGGPGLWAYTSPHGVQWDILAVTRATPELNALWRSGGLPVERRDNYTMTELAIKESTPVQIAAMLSGSATSRDKAVPPAAEGPAIEAARTGPVIASFSAFSVGFSSYFEEGATFDYVTGPIVDGIESVTLPAIRCAAVFIKGAYTQLGFAHYSLRLWLEQAGYTDAGREVREIYHYVEAPTSDANITELQVEIL